MIERARRADLQRVGGPHGHCVSAAEAASATCARTLPCGFEHYAMRQGAILQGFSRSTSCAFGGTWPAGTLTTRSRPGSTSGLPYANA